MKVTMTQKIDPQMIDGVFATAFTAGLSDDDAANAQIRWAAAGTIHYNNPLLQQLALAHSSGDPVAATATLDAVIGLGDLL